MMMINRMTKKKKRLKILKIMKSVKIKIKMNIKWKNSEDNINKQVINAMKNLEILYNEKTLKLSKKHNIWSHERTWIL